MATGDDWRETAKARRENITAAFMRELDVRNDESAAARLVKAISVQRQRPMIVSADIDGLVSACLMAQASDWRAVALIVQSETIYLHPDFHPDNNPDLAIEDLFGVDVFSSRFDNVSNHAVFWGPRKLKGHPDTHKVTATFDRIMQDRTRQQLVINPNVWVPIAGGTTGTGNPLGAPYRYTMGAAHVLVAALEAAGLPVRLMDREYLPWLIANCDGAVGSITGPYGFNVAAWWQGLAGAVGFGSVTEAIYNRVSSMRARDFQAVVSKLLVEDPATASHLNPTWKLTHKSLEDIEPVITWIGSLSGWPNPLHPGAPLSAWKPVQPSADLWKINALPAAATSELRLLTLRSHLVNSVSAVHTSLAYGGNLGDRLGCVAPWDGLKSRGEDCPMELVTGHLPVDDESEVEPDTSGSDVPADQDGLFEELDSPS